MRTTIIALFVFTVAGTAQAQTPLSVYPANHSQLVNDSSALQKKWSVSMYSGIGFGGAFFNNGGTGFLSPSIGVQLNRRLNNNLYAFAGVATGPAFFYPGRSFSADYHNNFMTSPGFNTNQWGINKSIQAGLMYVNDARTFSISGSIGVSHNSFPVYPITQKQPTFVGTRQ